MKPMLSSIAPADLLALTYPIAAEVKYDGVRTIAYVQKGNCILYSRNGKVLNNFEEINSKCSKMEAGVYDGEVISPKGFDALMTRTHADKGKNIDVPIEYKIFDKLTVDEWNKGSSTRKYVERVKGFGEYLIFKNPTHLAEYYQIVLKNGGEGLILKKLDSPYESGSKTYWHKLKPKDTIDLKISLVEEGLGKYKGMLGALHVHGVYNNTDNIYTSVGTGFTDEQRMELYKDKDNLIGKFIEVEFQEITKYDDSGSRSLRFPVFKCLRLDK